MKERRKSTRLRTRGLVQIEYGGQLCQLFNLSSTGTFARLARPPAVGKELRLRLVGERLPQPIDITAVVRRREAGRGMGLEFTHFHEADQWRLELLLATVSVARILVVDDDEDIRRMLSLLLERENYEVLTASDGVEGLQKAVELRPDLIILDLLMPGMPGLEVCQRVRANPGTTKIPVMVLSGTTNLADYDAAQKLGVVLFAPKPFRAPELLNYVRMLIER